MKFIALDYETSGLDPQAHAPVSLGVAVMDGEEVIDSREWTFSPPMKDGKITRAYDVVALQINGISWKTILAGQPIATVMQELRQWVGDPSKHLPVVAFNAPFDYSWYSTCLFLGGSWNQHLRRFETFKPPLVGPWHCARLLACDALSLERYDLDTVAANFNLCRESDKHGALEDAVLAGRIFSRIGAQ